MRDRRRAPLPIAIRPRQHQDMAQAAMQERPHHAVLLIEDNDDLREAFVALAEIADLEPVACTNARDGLEWLRHGLRPCLILLDLAMPGMNGLAFRREQLQDPELAAIPVVVCSGTSFTAEKQTELMGIAKFLRKPTDIKDLLQLFVDYGHTVEHR
jgi:twitching motility two-component system response regulator PilH